VTASPDAPQRRHRLLIVWMLFCSFWISAMLIFTAYTRPAPSFYLVGPLTIGVPIAVLIIGFIVERLRKKR